MTITTPEMDARIFDVFKTEKKSLKKHAASGFSGYTRKNPMTSAIMNQQSREHVINTLGNEFKTVTGRTLTHHVIKQVVAEKEANRLSALRSAKNAKTAARIHAAALAA